MNLCEFKVTLDTTPVQKHIQAVEAHFFDPSTKGEYKTGEDRGSELSLQLPSLGRGEISPVVRLFCFSDLQLEPQYLSLGFHYSWDRLCLKTTVVCRCQNIF